MIQYTIQYTPAIAAGIKCKRITSDGAATNSIDTQLPLFLHFRRIII